MRLDTVERASVSLSSVSLTSPSGFLLEFHNTVLVLK
jgi:hypothetical protein